MMLINYAKNKYSQNGEDGIILEIAKRLNISLNTNEWCVEFGACDGKHLSNTFALVEQGVNAVYIEGNVSAYEDLLKTEAQYPNIWPINAFVSRSAVEENSLDSLLKKTPIPEDFFLLSIDIDSYDLDVWESTSYQPKIVIIEINSAILPGIISRYSSKTPGNSFTATLNVGLNKGYQLICHTGNMIFIRKDLLSHLNIQERFIQYPELLFLYDGPSVSGDPFSQKHPLERIFPKFLIPFAKKIRVFYLIAIRSFK
jgi:hypothetical protein